MGHEPFYPVCLPVPGKGACPASSVQGWETLCLQPIVQIMPLETFERWKQHCEKSECQRLMQTPYDAKGSLHAAFKAKTIKTGSYVRQSMGTTMFGLLKRLPKVPD